MKLRPLLLPKPRLRERWNMLKNFLLIAWRSLLTNKVSSAIIMLGLVIGLTSALLISVFVRHEFSYDKHIPDAEKTYRVGFEVLENGVRVGTAKMAPGASPYIKQNVSSVADIVRFYLPLGGIMRIHKEFSVFNQKNVHFVDPNAFDFFPFERVKGDLAGAFDSPGRAVLTESVARKFFGQEDPIGKSLSLEGTNRVDVTVVAVVKDLVANTHLSTEMLVSIDTLRTVYDDKILDTLADGRAYTYVKLKPSATYEQFEKELLALFQRFQGKGEILTPLITKVSDIHLYAAATDNEMKINGNITIVYTYVAIALVILLVAAVNFMNIAIARSARRAKEVGIRKVMGATKQSLVIQFITEAVVMTLIALLISIGFAHVLLPAFGDAMNRVLAPSYLYEASFLLTAVGGSILLAVLSGSYPAFFLSNFQPAVVLKGEVSKGAAGVMFRKVLVVLQFSISVVLIIATAVVYQQMQFAKSERLGYNKDQMLTVKMPPVLTGQYEAFSNKLQQKQGVKHVVASSRMPTEHLGDMFALQIDGAEYQMYYYLAVQEEFFDAYEVEFLAGKNFSRNRTIDRVTMPDAQNPITESRMIVNESFIKLQGWSPQDAINKPVDIQLSLNPQEPLIKTNVIGVIKDLKFNSIRELSRPAVYVVVPSMFNRLSVKVDADNLNSSMRDVQSVWSEFLPNEPMEAQFLDVRFDALYHSEKQLSKLFTLFAVIAILISCLGLYGLVAFATERRRKEISIRKVLGATPMIINKLFLKEFLILVMVANLIGWPLAYMITRDWLNGFAYRIDMPTLVYVAGTVITLLIATVTVVMQVGLALKENTAEALRSE